MACIVAPMAEAIIVSVVKKIIKRRKRDLITKESTMEDVVDNSTSAKIDWLQKLSWLNHMLWGGVVLLTLEHVWHGEIILWPPFLTAMRNPHDIIPMFQEIVSVGIPMAVCVTMVWGIMIFALEHKVKIWSSRISKEEGGL